MTVQEMHDSFNLGLDKVNSGALPNFLVAEVDAFLNEAQDEFVEQRAWGTNTKRQGLEETQKRRDDLRLLVREVNLNSSGVGMKPNSVMFDLDGIEYRHAMSAECTITRLDCRGTSITERVAVTPITADRYATSIADPFNRPSEGRVYQMDAANNNGVEVIHSPNVTVGNYHLRYIKEPDRINVTNGSDCELADHTHREIVNMAVAHALGNIESPRIQLQMGENQMME